MKTYKILFIVSLILLILASVFIWYFMSAGVGADTKITSKSTKIQVVNANNEPVKAKIPLVVSVKAKNLNCEQINYAFKFISRYNNSKNSTICKSDDASFNYNVITDENGNTTISENLLAPIDNSKITKNVEDFIEKKFSAEMNESESKKLSDIINSKLNNEDQNKIKKDLTTLIKEYLTRNYLYQESSGYLLGKRSNNTNQIIENDYVVKIISSINSSGQDSQKASDYLKLTGQKIIESVTVKIDTELLTSEPLNISFKDKEYKQSVNLVAYDNQTTSEMALTEEYIKYLIANNKISKEQEESYRNILNQFIEYSTERRIEQIISKSYVDYQQKSAAEKEQIRYRFRLF